MTINATVFEREKPGRMPRGAGEAVKQGYEDARSELPYRPEYELMTEDQQVNYERARLYVMNLRRAGMDVPPWADPFPPNHFEDLNAAQTLVGDPIPQWREEQAEQERRRRPMTFRLPTWG